VTRLPGLSADHYKEMVANAPPDEEMGDMKMDGDKGSPSDEKGSVEKSGAKPGHPH
jgi:hypothetical protein